jgi:putative glutamine amidotransferase
MKLYSALYNDFYPFKDMGLFTDFESAMHPEELEKGGALVVWGGGDISPSLYKKAVSSRTHADAHLSKRDDYEWRLMQRAKELEMPIIGICRGAQMLCALAGGFVVQDVSNHTSGHEVVTKEGDKFHVSSLHHQMLHPWEVDHELIAWTETPLSRHYISVNDEGEDEFIEMKCEPEFVYFPKEKGIAIQWHPEFMKETCTANMYVKKKIEELL